MDRNAAPPKTKAPPSDTSEEETGSSDEETDDEEHSQGGSGFESGSDRSTDTTKRKLVNASLSRQPSSVKAAAPASVPVFPAKRTRQSIGKKDKEDEPPSKKNKAQVAAPAPRAAAKSEKRRATKAEKGKLTPTVKEKPLTAEKKSATKRKTGIPAPKTSVSSKSEDEIPQKTKSSSQPWSPDEELALSKELQRDRVNDLYGLSLPSSRADPYWVKLIDRLSFLDKYEKEQRIERLCEKIRRMRLRYESLNTRLRADEKAVYKSLHEAVLWRIWHTIWGPLKATQEMLEDPDCELDYQVEEGSSGAEEEDQEDVVPIQVQGRHRAVGRTPAKRVTSKKVVVLDGSSSDDTPVKATPPVVAAASVETSGAGKQGAGLNSVLATGLSDSAMDVDSGRNTSRVAVRNGVQGAHALSPEVMAKSVRADAVFRGSDEMLAENLALLRDMRGTCVKMVEEAKSQSLLVTAKILEETRAKTIQIVEEARVKSSLIMEELRLVIERLGTFAGHSSEANASLGGRWGGMYDDPFQGLGPDNGKLFLGDLTNVKWLEQLEAEEVLIIRRLELVQEQQRILLEGIRRKLNIQKQQAAAEGK